MKNRDVIRPVAFMLMSKDSEGNLAAFEGAELDDENVRELGAIISGLAVLQAGDIQMAKKEAEKGVNEAAERNFGISEDRILQIADELSKDVSAFFILLEHQCARQFRGY